MVAGFAQRIFDRYPALSFAAYRRYWFASFSCVGGPHLINHCQVWLIF